jgi:hypothetical protein
MTTRQILAQYLGQPCPKPSPRADEAVHGPQKANVGQLPGLGRPLNLREAAGRIGCSPWTVRHNLIPKGLPVFRSGASSKLIFYEEQLVAWIKKTQGGNTK